ncbi:MAG: ABC transporter permease [Eubacterium sp.]|nr:ABC transporter permease [Eubacterium sp.]
MNTAKERSGLQKVLRSRDFFTLCLLVAVFLFSFMLSDSFHDLAYILKCATRYVELGMVAYTMTFIIITGMIDLSAPAIMCTSATIAALLNQAGAPMGLCIVVAFLVGLGLGAINGTLVAVAQLPAMIATIGTMNAFRGIAQILIGDKSVSGLPKWFLSVEKRPVFMIGKANFSVTLLLFIILGIIAYIILHKTGFGRKIYGIGTNEQAVIAAGVSSRKIKFGLFCASGMMCSLAGLLTMSRLQLVRYDMALNQEIEIITMVLLGGADINGGSGGILGTILAVVIVIFLKTGLIVANVTSDQQTFVMGVLLLVTIVVPNLIHMISTKRLEKEAKKAIQK